MALNMLQKRTLASCCVLNQGRTLWITGGEDGDFALNSTEFITLEENPVIGPELPFTIRFLSFTSLSRQNKWASSFSRCLNGTFPSNYHQTVLAIISDRSF